MKISRPPQSAPSAAPKPSSAADLLGLGNTVSNIDVYLGSEEYQNIDERGAARMLGHFTQGMQAQGFPWKLQVASRDGLRGKLTGTRTLGDMEALRRLQKGEPVLFQPMRNLQLDLSSDSLGAIAAAGSVAGGTEASSVARLATITKNTRVSPGSQGLELRHGEPVEVRNLSELKLLYQMYHPEEKITSKNPVAQAANQLAYFNQQQGDYGWRFYQKDEGHAAPRIAKAFAKNALRGAAMGAAVGAMIGAPIALFTQSAQALLTATGIGAGAFAVYSGVESARSASKGKPLNTVEVLDAVLKQEPIEFQETQMRSVGVPVLGKVSWFTDRGQSSAITSPAELDTFYYMQNQAAKIETPAKPEPPKPPSVLVIDQSQHHYYR